MCQSLFVPKIINICGTKLFSFIAAGCSKEPGQTHRGDRGTKSCLSHWPPGCLLANLIMLEANCDHPSLVVLTITSQRLWEQSPFFSSLMKPDAGSRSG